MYLIRLNLALAHLKNDLINYEISFELASDGSYRTLKKKRIRGLDHFFLANQKFQRHSPHDMTVMLFMEGCREGMWLKLAKGLKSVRVNCGCASRLSV